MVTSKKVEKVEKTSKIVLYIVFTVKQFVQNGAPKINTKIPNRPNASRVGVLQLGNKVSRK